MALFKRPLHGNPSTSHHRYNREGEAVTRENLYLQRPDGYVTTDTKWIPWEWIGCINECGTYYQKLKQMIADNGGTAVGLKFELAATPNRVELEAIWWENLLPVPGLIVKLSVQDIDYNDIVTIPGADKIDLGKDPMGSAIKNCQGCGAGEDTFYKYRFDRSEDKLTIGRCNTARLVLEIVEEPEGGLFGDKCKQGCPILFRGGFGFEAFCIHRGLASKCGKNFECLDGCPAEEAA